MRLFVGFFLVLVLTSLEVQAALSCKSFLAYRVVPSEPVYDYEDDAFKVRDRLNPQFKFEGHLVSGGILFVSAHLKDPSSLTRSSLNGAELYQQMVDHIGLDRIEEIAGYWVNGDNLRAFENNLKNGMSKEEAALQTWSGQQALRFGFSEVIDVAHFLDRLGGESNVQLYFSRP